MSAYSTYNDQELAALLKGGDYAAFTEIYNRNWAQVLKYVSKIVHDGQDAQDVVQEVFISFWNRHKELELRSFSSWLFGAARRQALFYLRTSSNRDKYVNNFAHYLSEIIDPLNEQLDAKELAEFIDREIEKLPVKMREVFVMSRKDNLSYKEIAAQLHISDKTVKKQVNNVLKQFRLKLDDESAGLIAITTILLFRK